MEWSSRRRSEPPGPPSCCPSLPCYNPNLDGGVQDEYAVESYGRAYAASQNGLFGAEIVGVEVEGKMVTQDEEVERVGA